MKLFPFILALVLCGCCNVAQHRDGTARPFCGTRGNANTMSEVFVSRPDLHGGSISEAEIAHAYAVVFSPALILSLPFEIVADVVTLPYDMIFTTR